MNRPYHSRPSADSSEPAPPPRDASGNALFLEGVTVSVNYADFLDVALSHNLAHFDEFVVVTSHEDRATQRVCARHSVTCVVTDVFTERPGDAFNKGLALNLGLAHLRHQGWLLNLDADIILPDRFRSMLHKARLEEHCLYGADRVNIVGSEMWERVRGHHQFQRQFQHRYLVAAPAEARLGARLLHDDYGYCPIGYFQLWHGSAQKRYPINQGSAEHTDVLFALHWPAARRRLLPTAFCYHLESERAEMGANWTGRTTRPFTPGR